MKPSTKTPRYYLVQSAQHHVTQESGRGPFNRALNVIAAVHLLYGAEIRYMHGGVTKPLTGSLKKHDDVLDASVEPYLRVAARGYPFMRYKYEPEILARELSKMGYEEFWPYLTWVTAGDKIRKKVNKVLEKGTKTAYFASWEKRNEVFKKRAVLWIEAFYAQNKKTKIQFWRKSHNSFILHIRPTRATKHVGKMSAAQVRARYEECQKELEAYADFLVAGFVSGPSKQFPLTEFEK